MYIVVFVTAKNKREANKIAKHLVSQKLIACVNIVDSVQSIFSWKNKTEVAKEVLLIIKTRKALFNKLKIAVRKLHSYDVPEIIALPIVAGNKEYLDWVKESTTGY